MEVAETDYEFFVDAFDNEVALPTTSDSFTVTLPRP